MLTNPRPFPRVQNNHSSNPRIQRTLTYPKCRICRILERSGKYEGELYVNHYGYHPIHCPQWCEMSVGWRIHISRLARYCLQCFSPRIFIENITDMKPHYGTECSISHTNKLSLSRLNTSCLQHSWTCPTHTEENRPLLSTHNKRHGEAPNQRRMSYTPAVSLTPTLMTNTVPRML